MDFWGLNHNKSILYLLTGKLNTGVNGFDGDARAQAVAGRGANLVKKAPKIVADETLALAA
jgi:hypothetical protein